MKRDPTGEWPSFFVYPNYNEGTYAGKVFKQEQRIGDEKVTIEWQLRYRTKVALGKRIMIAALESPKIIAREKV